jgi:hypothetical protein
VLPCLLLISFYGPALNLSEETAGYSFQLEDGSAVSFLTGRDSSSIVFRYGTQDSIYLEYPGETVHDSRSLFSTSSYERNGGAENEGMYTYTVSFTVNDSIVTVYDDYYAPDSLYSTGISIAFDTTLVLDEEGIYSTRNGTLSLFLNNCFSLE